MSKVIKITCAGSGAMPLDDFKDFQGNLKTLSKAKLEAGIKSIIKYGFSVPVAVWKGHKDILDGHQRLFIVRYMIENLGYSIDGDVPYVDIMAKNRKEAAEKVLQIFNSKYGDITDDGLYEFINDFDIDIEAMAGEGLDLPDLDINDFLNGWVRDAPEKQKVEPENGNEMSEDLNFQILVFCADENQQAKIMEYLEREGVECKPMIL